MVTLIETSLWIDFTRARSPQSLKQFIAPFILHPQAHVAEPVTFELLRYASTDERPQLARQFETFPQLATPSTLWDDAAQIGQACRKSGFTAGSIDLLIAAVAQFHEAELVTFDADFERISAASGIRVKRLVYPGE